MSIFKKNANRSLGKSREALIGEIAKDFYSDVQLGRESVSLLGALMLSRESVDESQIEQLDETSGSVIASTATSISDTAKKEGAELTPEEVDNIQESLVIAANPEAYLKSGDADETAGTVHGILGGEVEAAPVQVEMSKESFEVHGMMNTLAMTVAYNVRADKQSKAAELFFPTINLDFSSNTYTIDTQLSTVFTEKEYEVTGKRDAYRNQKHIIKSLRNHTILKSNFTDVIPVFRQGQNEDSFVDTALLPVRSVENDNGEKFQTSLLRIGEEIKLLDISQTNRMIALGMQDGTDQIAGNPRLKTIGLKVGNDTVLFENLQYHQASQFTYSPKGDREDILLTYDVNTHLLDENTKAVKSGKLPTELQALKDKGLEALVRLVLTGRGNTDTSAFEITSGSVKVTAIRDAVTKEVKDLEDPALKPLIDAIKETEVIGWEIDATRTNSNIREHGMVLDSRVQRIIYGVRLHSPIAVRRPFDEKTDVTDAQRVDTLIQTNYMRRTNAAITALYDILGMLKAAPQKLDTTEPFAHSIVGIGQYFSKNYVHDVALDVYKTTQSMQTTDVRANASAVITNFVLAEMTQAYTSSELAAAYEIISGGANFRPHVIAIADVFTSKFIFREGDARTLGDGFDFTIEECSDNRLVDQDKDGEVGTIFLSFGVPKNGSLDIPLWFGNCLSKREIPRIVNRARGSKYQHEVMVQPWFSHICHLPILVRIRVTGLKKAVQERIPFAVQALTKEGEVPLTAEATAAATPAAPAAGAGAAAGVAP